ncbi:MAG: radical SAM protein [Geminicoccaceae bacterium]
MALKLTLYEKRSPLSYILTMGRCYLLGVLIGLEYERSGLPMVQAAALPNDVESTYRRPILTFIVPAPKGCNLNCPFCYIDKRNEPAQALDLTPADYIAFIDQVAAWENIGAICLQGYEPLLPESFAYTRAILKAGERLGIPTSLVTNGTYLEHWVDELAELRPDKITVSIDSADAATHDKTRGKTGAFEDAMRGLRLAVADAELQPVLSLASILMPQRHKRLLGMPALAAELGIKHWVITVLNDVGMEEIGGPVGDRRRTFADLLILKREAERHGIDFVVDDEFGTLSDEDAKRDVVDINELRIRRLAQPSGTFRLLPTGQCSMGLEILKEVKPDTPRWQPGVVDAFDFIEDMRARQQA